MPRRRGRGFFSRWEQLRRWSAPLAFLLVLGVWGYLWVTCSFWWVPEDLMGNAPGRINSRRVLLEVRRFRATDLKRGDRIVFAYGPEGKESLARVVALPGDRVAIHGARWEAGKLVQSGRLYLDGRPAEESYLPGWGGDLACNVKEIIVPGKSVWVLNDHRESRYRLDSRWLGPIREAAIIGKVAGLGW